MVHFDSQCTSVVSKAGTKLFTIRGKLSINSEEVLQHAMRALFFQIGYCI